MAVTLILKLRLPVTLIKQYYTYNNITYLKIFLGGTVSPSRGVKLWTYLILIFTQMVQL